MLLVLVLRCKIPRLIFDRPSQVWRWKSEATSQNANLALEVRLSEAMRQNARMQIVTRSSFLTL